MVKLISAGAREGEGSEGRHGGGGYRSDATACRKKREIARVPPRLRYLPRRERFPCCTCSSPLFFVFRGRLYTPARVSPTLEWPSIRESKFSTRPFSSRYTGIINVTVERSSQNQRLVRRVNIRRYLVYMWFAGASWVLSAIAPRNMNINQNQRE